MKRHLQQFLLSLPIFEALCRLVTRKRIRALMYHRFSEQATADSRFVDAATLAAQLAYIRRHHTPITPDDHLVQHTTGVRPAGSCPVVVTVDDGYRDLLEIAHPRFRDAGIPVMLFMTTSLADGDFWFWWDKIEYLLGEAEAAEFELDVLGRDIALDLRSPAGRKQAWSDVADRCRFAPNDEKLSFIADLATRLGVELPAQPPRRYRGVTWDELRTMVDEGLLVGAHTQNHPILSRVAHEEAEREIGGSRRKLEQELERPVPWFCYPQGGPADYTDAICAYLEREEFVGSYLAYQVTTHPGDPYRMPRYCVDTDMVSFRWMMCGAEAMIRRVKSWFGLQHDISSSYWTS